MRLARTWLALLALALAACSGPRASEADCRIIFDRLVALELEEMGYRDPTLLSIRQNELSQRYQAEMGGCVGRPLPDHAMACIGDALSAEALSHNCLE